MRGTKGKEHHGRLGPTQGDLHGINQGQGTQVQAGGDRRVRRSNTRGTKAKEPWGRQGRDPGGPTREELRPRIPGEGSGVTQEDQHARNKGQGTLGKAGATQEVPFF